MTEVDILRLLRRARNVIEFRTGRVQAMKVVRDADTLVERLERAEIVEGVAYMGLGEWRWYQGYKPDQPGDRRAILIVLEADDE